MALNRFDSLIQYESRDKLIAAGIKCVFISHQQSDKESAKKIADYLLQAGINVYFDEYDKNLKLLNQVQNPQLVTKAICNGINNSSHMLVIVSPSTLPSAWVPFEIGYGFEKTDLSVLCLKGIAKGKLPEYIRAAKVIRDIYDLNSFITSTSGKTSKLLIETKMMSEYDTNNNPLNSVMDTLINDRY